MTDTTSLWLPGFDFADLVFDQVVEVPAQIAATVTETPSLPIEIELDEIKIVNDVDSNAFVLETVLTPEITVAQEQVISVCASSSTQSSLSTAPWPELAGNFHSGLSGQVTKFKANLEAIKLLNAIEFTGAAVTNDQRDTLNKYTGWGGIKQPFDRFPASDWIERTMDLKNLLTEEQFQSASDSTMDAHFTPLPIVKSVWDIVRKLGFTGGRVLDPSAGTGFFIGAMPTDMVMKSSLTAVEIDDISAKFLSTLYGGHTKVLHTGFEKANLPDEYFDLVISNIPFGNRQVGDLRRKAYSDFAIHNYFIARSLDLVRAGGLVVVLTSAFFMDAQNENVRAYIGNKAKLLGAIRLPVGTFSDIASTDVVVDLVVFQKRQATEYQTPEERVAFVPTASLKDETGKILTGGAYNHPMSANNYWSQNRGNVIGEWTSTTYNRGQAIVPKLRQGVDLMTEVNRIVGTFPEGVYKPSISVVREVSVVSTAHEGALPGTLVIKNGGIAVFNGFSEESLPIKGKVAERIVGLIGIRDTTRSLLTIQSSANADVSKMASLRFELNTRYDNFVAKNGIITSAGNRKAMSRDPSWPLLLSLEMYDSESDSASKADIFYERTTFSTDMPKSAETELDALAICVAETGVIDSEIIGKLMSRDGNVVLESLAATGDVFIDPVTGMYLTATEYLAGNVREKLALAKTMGIAFERNVRALTAALPKDLTPSQIDVVPGANWIPNADVEAFVQYIYRDDWKNSSYASASAKFESVAGTWSINCSGPSMSTDTQWGTTRMTAEEILQDCFNQVDSTVRDKVDDNYVINASETATARLKQEDLRTEFKSWLWGEDKRAQRLCSKYNELFNCWAVRKHNGSKLRLPGYSNALTLREHQANAVAQIATGLNTLLAHVVGAGKTLTMVCGSMELRRLGIAKKPVHVVLNSTLEQYCAEFMRAYPNARLLMATKEDFKREKRKEFAARCATGDWDCIVMTHTMFERIAADPELVEDYLDSILSELKVILSEGNLSRIAERAVKKHIKDWEAKLEKMQAAWKKDALVTLGMTGIDYCFLDEAHIAKNLFRISKMKSIAGLNNSNSQRSFDLLLKTAQIMRMHGGREAGLCFATGTVISNSVAEMHVMQRYLQPATLAKLGLEKFDPWAAQFGRAVNSMEVSPDGSSFRMNKRFKVFVNMAELMGQFRQVADIQTREMLNLPVPVKVTGSHQICAVEASQEVKNYVAELVERCEAIRNRQVQPNEDNMLCVTSDGTKVALDYRLIDPAAPFDPNGKVGACLKNVHRIWELTAGFKGTQLIFSDMGTPTGKSLNLYEDMRKRLVAMGIPREQIAFIHEADSDSAKSVLFSRVRAGSIRVVIGSTSKLGTGTNVQTRLYAVHHLTTPWRPSDIEQRDGRIERQGNTCEAIEIWRYVTQGTFDAYMWQTLTAKAGFIAQVMAGNAEIRTVEDAMMATLSYDEVKALACGNPAVREKATIDAEIMALSLKRKLFNDQQWHSKNEMWQMPQRIEMAKDTSVAYGKWGELLNEKSADGLYLDVANKRFTDVKKIEQVLTLTIAELTDRCITQWETKMLGNICGAEIHFVTVRNSTGFTIEARMPGEKNVAVSLGSYTTGGSILRKWSELQSDVLKISVAAQGRAQYMTEQLASYSSKSNDSFPEEDRFAELVARSKAIAIELGLLKAMSGTDGVDENDVVASSRAAELVVVEDESEDQVGSEADEELAELN
jgi:N12 class adenine-specific DNA methylase/predicted RNA methylase